MKTTDVIRNMNNAGGPAFPTRDLPGGWTGMSLRDYYAGCLMMGGARPLRGDHIPGVVSIAFDIAQAMVDEGIRRDNEK